MRRSPDETDCWRHRLGTVVPGVEPTLVMLPLKLISDASRTAADPACPADEAEPAARRIASAHDRECFATQTAAVLDTWDAPAPASDGARAVKT